MKRAYSVLVAILVLCGLLFAESQPAPWRITAPPPDWKLSPFYKKHVSVRGFPVLGSAKVSDFALLEAAYLIDKMLACRADILAALVKNKVRFAVMAYSERTTDIPEHSDLKPAKFWDRRARGLGPTHIRLAVSCGEENLLGFPGDPYAKENILVHEFAHAIHLMGLNSIDRDFNERLRQTYRAAMDRGLWKNTYAATNPEEYWAEGVQSWFDTNRRPDHDHNDIDTRAKLAKYDLTLAKLIADVFRDNPWRYEHPAKRKHKGHLEGYDPAKAPRFAWSPESEKWYRDYQAALEKKGRPAAAPRDRQAILDKQKLLENETFWDNRDWDWYKENIPFFECPDPDITTTYYYRWELVTKHLTYGSPNTGYVFTEFSDRPFWSGRYGAISCPAGHQLNEVRWLRDPRYAWDYARYWFRTPGAAPRRYSTWLADAILGVHHVHPDEDAIKDLLPDLIKNYEAWEKSHFDAKVGLFWQTGHDDGMEININSRQTKDTVRGAPGYRPTLNSYMLADARAIARIAFDTGDEKTAVTFLTKLAGIKKNMLDKLWDPKRHFFFPMARKDDKKDGHLVKALTLTYQTGKYAGNSHGRELIGYVPWQFLEPYPKHDAAWKFLMDRNYFFGDFGPTTVERHDPQFLISKQCCVWSGQSWPYATTQTLKALANAVRSTFKPDGVSKADYLKLLMAYTKTHRKAGKPYIAEAAHPDTGSWDGHDSYNHSEHYFHSGYVDLIITGLVGLESLTKGMLSVHPSAPADWDYFALDGVMCQGRSVTVLWDRKGDRYGFGKGLHVFADGKKIESEDKLNGMLIPLPPRKEVNIKHGRLVNFAVNNDGTYSPRVTASFSNPKTTLSKVNDGNYWYALHPPNRWTCEGSPNPSDWCAIDFGTKRKIHTVKLYLLDDGENVLPPERIDLEYWNGKAWKEIPAQSRNPKGATGRRANVIRFPELETNKVRAVFSHRKKSWTGLTEFEAWGDANGPVAEAPMPAGNLAYNPGDKKFPRVTASFTSRFDKVQMANDSVISFNPTPHNRWTCFESPNTSDWLEVDLGEKKRVGRVELHIYDDRGGVQAPAGYIVQFWDGTAWLDALNQKKNPTEPAGGIVNTVTFTPVGTNKLRVVCTHQGKSRSGLSEIEVWEK